MKKSCGILFMALLLTSCAAVQKTYVIKDECGPIQGNIFHSVQDEDSCRIRCRGNCQALEMEYVQDRFIDHGIRCNECNCTCSTTSTG
ncbi:MAG: hypothetical protein V1837_02735 [Candidatus Woesearchaeota archaeon]